GCGGRNDPAAHECEWCGRLFVAERRQFNTRWIAPAGAATLLVLVLTVITFGLLGSRFTARTPADVPIVVQQDVDVPDDDESAFAMVDPTSTATVAATPTENGRAEFVRIANTGGTGAFIRREARAGSPGIVAYRDGTVLRIVGPDANSDGRAWRQVEDRQGNRGWTPREYLEPSATGF